MGFWKEIRKEGSLMLKNITFSVGDGRRVRFWKNKWCGNNTLHDSFPSLFALVVSKDAWVVDCWDSLGEEGGWNPRFSRSFNDWEVEAVARLLSTLQGKRLVVGLEDKVVWKETKNEIFFLLNPFIILLNLVVQSRFHGTSFRALVFLLRWVFLLGKLHGGRS